MVGKGGGKRQNGKPFFISTDALNVLRKTYRGIKKKEKQKGKNLG